MKVFENKTRHATLLFGVRGWRGARPRRSMPMWARFVVMIGILAVALIASWQVLWDHVEGNDEATRVEAAVPQPQPAMRFRDSLYSKLEEASGYAGAGSWAQAISATDDAAKIIRDARHNGLRIPPDNFEEMVASVDRVHSLWSDQKSLDSLNRARVELAEYRSSLEPPLPGSQHHTEVIAPRNIPAGTHVLPASFSSSILDASGLPEEAEILLPPHSRLFVENVWVEGLTLIGASQTLDGVHWKDITFANSRIRYQGGEVELRNVRFVNCTFGFATNDRGARLADAIALGPVSVVIE